MDSNKETIKSLNRLLQGEYMAVEVFNIFLAKVSDEKVKKVFQEIQGQHRQNIAKLATYIQNNGGRPQENLGLKGMVADMKINMDLALKLDTREIIEKVIEGETQGVNMAEKVLRGDLDDQSRDVAGEVLQKDRNSIAKLKGLL